ncbi:MAG TPA: hypothetical protein VGK36_14400 [Candidatus Angelobacter sp.]|jgi:hypothetical protein
MKLPQTTSGLLALQEATNAELRLRLAGIFQHYRKLAFIGRNDNLFTEHWTPEVAAAGYNFDGFEIKDATIVLHGVENACGFIYHINIALPLDLIDDTVAIDAYFQRRFDEAKVEGEFSATAPGADPISSAFTNLK